MTDYNDGEWHLWNSMHSPCGVHPESLVSYIWHDERTGECGFEYDTPAGRVVWTTVLKFQVTKVHHEPRVIYVNEYADGGHIGYDNPDIARRAAMHSATRTAVRYVEAPE